MEGLEKAKQRLLAAGLGAAGLGAAGLGALSSWPLKGTTVRDDRVYSITRGVAAITLPFLGAAFYILYFRTNETQALFAWEIQAPMSALMLASAYLGGMYFLGRAVAAPRWHWIGLGFLPITVFSTVMALTTLRHWERFSHGHFTFYAWVLLYATTPFAFFGVWFHNRLTDPGTPEAGDFTVPRLVQYAIGSTGLASLGVSLVLFVQPVFMIGLWPWPLTPLTARVMSSLFALQGVFGLGLMRDARWSAARLALESQLVSMIFVLIALVRVWGTLDPTRFATWVFVVTVAAICIVIPVGCAAVERRRRGLPSSSPNA